MKFGTSRNSIVLCVALAFLVINQCISWAHADEASDSANNAEILRRALLSRDTWAVSNILACRFSEERLRIAAAYGERNKLVNDIKVTLTGDFEDLVMTLMTPLHDIYASILADEASSIYCARSTLVDIIVTSPNDELKAFNDGNPSLVKDLTANCKGALNDTIHELFNGTRNENQVVDANAAKADAQLLYQILEVERAPSTWFMDQFRMKDIFVTSSYRQLRKIFKKYKSCCWPQY